VRHDTAVGQYGSPMGLKWPEGPPRLNFLARVSLRVPRQPFRVSLALVGILDQPEDRPPRTLRADPIDQSDNPKDASCPVGMTCWSPGTRTALALLVVVFRL